MTGTKGKKKNSNWNSNWNSNSNTNSNNNENNQTNENWVDEHKRKLLVLDLNKANNKNIMDMLESTNNTNQEKLKWKQRFMNIRPKIKQILFKNMINAAKNKNFKTQVELKKFFITKPEFRNRTTAYLRAFPFISKSPLPEKKNSPVKKNEPVQKKIKRSELNVNIKDYISNKNINKVTRKELARYLASLNKYKNYNESVLRNILVNFYEPRHFEKLKGAQTPSENILPDLESMTVKALQEYADKQGIIYLKSLKKADLISVIRRGSVFNKMQTANLMKLSSNKKLKAREALILHLMKTKPNLEKKPNSPAKAPSPKVVKKVTLNIKNANGRSVKNLIKEAKDQGFFVIPGTRNQVMKVLARKHPLNAVSTIQLSKRARNYGIRVNVKNPSRENYIQALMNVNFTKPPPTKKEKMAIKKTKNTITINNKNWVIHRSKPSGDCFYESVLVASGKSYTNKDIQNLRQMIHDYMQNKYANRENNEAFGTTKEGESLTKRQYLNEILRPGCWADGGVITAAQHVLKVKIKILGPSLSVHRGLSPDNSSASYKKTVYLLYDAENTNKEGGTHFDALIPATPNTLGVIAANLPYVPIKKYISVFKSKSGYKLKNENLNRTIANIIADVVSPAPAPAPAPVPILNEPVKVEPPPIKKSEVTSPREYQKLVAETLLKDDQRGLIAVHSIGSGKTLTAILASDALIRAEKVEHIVIISPKTLVRNFKQQLKIHGFGSLEKKCTFYSYDAATNHLLYPDKYKKLTGRLTDELISKSFVIIDEIHNLNTHITGPDAKEQKGIKAKTILTHCRKAPKILGLTATPVVNEFKDLKNMINTLSGGNFNSKTFTKTSAVKYGINYGKYFSFYERSINDPRFPSFTVYRTKIPMSNDYYVEYKKLEASYKAKHGVQSEAFYLKMRTGSNEIQGVRNEKVEWLFKHILDTVKRGKKCIIYSQFREYGLKILMKRFKELKIPFSEITGDSETNFENLNKDERYQAQQDYNSGKVKIIFLSKAGGEGIDLKMTENVYIMEPTWNPAQLYQAIGRGVRLGSHAAEAPKRGHVNAYCVSLSFSEEQFRLESANPHKGKEIPKSVEDHLYDDILDGKFKELELFYSTFLPHSIGYGTYNSQNRPSFMKQNKKIGYGIYNKNNPTFSETINNGTINVNRLRKVRNNALNQAKTATYKLIDIMQKMYPKQVGPWTKNQREIAIAKYKSIYGENYTD